MERGFRERYSLIRSLKLGIPSMIGASSGCPKMTICSSFSVLVSKLSSSRRTSSAAGASFWPSSMKRTRLRPSFSARSKTRFWMRLTQSRRAVSSGGRWPVSSSHRWRTKASASSKPGSSSRKTSMRSSPPSARKRQRQSVLLPVPTSPSTTLSPRRRRMAISSRCRQASWVGVR